MPNYVIFEKNVDGAENFAHIDPMLNASQELDGFIFTDSIENQVSLYFIQGDSTRIIDFESTPQKTVHYYDQDNALVLYTLVNKPMIGIGFVPIIIQTTISDFGVEQETIDVNPFSNWGKIEEITRQDIRIESSVDNNARFLIFESNYKFVSQISDSNTETEYVPTSVVYSTDDNYEIYRAQISSIDWGTLMEDELYNDIKVLNYDFSWDDRFNKGAQKYTYLTISDTIGNEIYSFESDSGETYDVFIGQFFHSTPEEEIIYHGNSNDLAGYYNQDEFIASYKIVNGYPEELWYTEIDDVKFKYIFKSGDQLVGISKSNYIISLNVLSGEITDSVKLEHELNSMSFFESGNYQPELSLLGLSHDTIFVYKFENSFVNKSTGGEENIPRSFELLKNHPNPFNGETRIEFITNDGQYLTLKIYNILGQEIKNLAANSFGPGNYTYYWDGSNEDGASQSSGIYFARLEGLTGSQMIKLIYIK
jgi:hypothetical protein